MTPDSASPHLPRPAPSKERGMVWSGDQAHTSPPSTRSTTVVSDRRGCRRQLRGTGGNNRRGRRAVRTRRSLVDPAHPSDRTPDSSSDRCIASRDSGGGDRPTLQRAPLTRAGPSRPPSERPLQGCHVDRRDGNAAALADLVVPRSATFAVGAGLSLLGFMSLARTKSSPPPQTAEPTLGLSSASQPLPE